MNKIISFLTRLFKHKKEREWMLWTGNDHFHCVPPDTIGKEVDFEGRKGKVVDASLLRVLVEWE